MNGSGQEPPMPTASAARDEHGLAPVAALLAVIFLSLAVAGILMSIGDGPAVPGVDPLGSPARAIAEVGAAEAMARLRAGEFSDAADPRREWRFSLADRDPAADAGADAIAPATLVPVNRWLVSDTPAGGDVAIAVRYRTDPAHARIVRYDPSVFPSIQTSTGSPILTIASRGRSGDDRATILADVTLTPFDPAPRARAALAAGADIRCIGSAQVCGRNHSPTIPAGTWGHDRCRAFELATGHLPGAWSGGAVSWRKSPLPEGDPPILERQSGFPAEPWECVGLSRQRFQDWVGHPSRTGPRAPRGIVYLQDEARPRGRRTAFAFHGGSGAGMLYVDGDLRLSGEFRYVGLIYVEGDLEIDGPCWILGSVVVKGRGTIGAGGGKCCVLYSANAVRQSLARYGGEVSILSWREER
jgi:hypothetical protein